MIPLRDNISSKHVSWFLWLILLANFYVFWLEIHFNPKQLEAFILHWGVTPALLFKFPLQKYFTLVTAMFIHGGWIHLLGNMLFFYIFADSVEDQLGHFKFFIFYFTVGVIANFIQAYTSPHSVLPLIGASGAIAGILGAYFFYFPHSRITTLIPLGFFITIREVPAFFFLGCWFLLQMFNGSHVAGQSSNGGVAWWAHASGFIAGLLLAPLFAGRKGTYN